MVFPPLSVKLLSPPLKESNCSFKPKTPTLKSNPGKFPDSQESWTALPELSNQMELLLFGEEIWPMSSDISLLKLWTLPLKIPSNYTYVPSTPKLKDSNSSSEISLLEELLELALSLSSIPSISLELDLPLIWEKLKEDNSMDLLIVLRKSELLMEFPDYIKVSLFPFSELSLIEPFTSEDMTQENNSFSLILNPPPSGKNSCSLNSLLPFPVLPHIP